MMELEFQLRGLTGRFSDFVSGALRDPRRLHIYFVDQVLASVIRLGDRRTAECIRLDKVRSRFQVLLQNQIDDRE